MSDGLSAFGTTLKWNGETIAELTSIGGPGISVDTIDLTHHASADGFREFVGGLADGGEVSIEGNFIPSDTAGQVALIADMIAKTVREVIITGPTAGAFTWTFNALIIAFEPAHPYDDKLSFTATMKVIGKPVLGITASANISAMSFVDSVGAKTPIPAFAAAVYTYTLTIATASGWVKVTVTQGTAVSIVATALGVAHTLTTEVQSEQIAVGDADSVTELTVVVRDSGKVAKTYTIYVQRPGA